MGNFERNLAGKWRVYGLKIDILWDLAPEKESWFYDKTDSVLWLELEDEADVCFHVEWLSQHDIVLCSRGGDFKTRLERLR